MNPAIGYVTLDKSLNLSISGFADWESWQSLPPSVCACPSAGQHPGWCHIRLASHRLCSVDEQEGRSGQLALSTMSSFHVDLLCSSRSLSVRLCVCLLLSLHVLWLCVAGCGDSASLLAVDREDPATSFSSGHCVARL